MARSHHGLGTEYSRGLTLLAPPIDEDSGPNSGSLSPYNSGHGSEGGNSPSPLDLLTSAYNAGRESVDGGVFAMSPHNTNTSPSNFPHAHKLEHPTALSEGYTDNNLKTRHNSVVRGGIELTGGGFASMPGQLGAGLTHLSQASQSIPVPARKGLENHPAVPHWLQEAHQAATESAATAATGQLLAAMVKGKPTEKGYKSSL